MKARPRLLTQSLRCWLELALLVVFVAGSLGLVNVIAYNHRVRLDMTPEKTYTLSSQTRRVLDSLSEDLHAMVFYRQQEEEEMRDILERVARYCDRFHYTFLNLEKNPARAETFGIQRYGAGVLMYQGRREKIAYCNEENLVSGIIRLTEKTTKIIRFVTGHGEKNIETADPETGYSRIMQALETENYTAENLLLMQAGRVPDDTLVLVAAGPQKDYFEKELAVIDDYLKQGGRVIMCLDPFPLPVIEQWLQRRYGVQLTRDFIIDAKSKLMGLDNLSPIVRPDENHPITQYMSETVVFPYCRSVIPEGGAAADSSVSVFARTGPDSWAERDTQSVYEGRVSFDPGMDLAGPVPVSAIVTVHEGAETGRLLVMGDSEFATNHYMNLLGNKDLFLNMVNWLSGQSRLISARPKKGSAPVSMLFLTENQGRLIFWLSVVVEPALILLAGLLVMLWRRARR